MEVKVIEVKDLMDLTAAIAYFCDSMSNCDCAKNREECQMKDTSKVKYDFIFFIQKIADKKGWSFEEANKLLGHIKEISPSAAFSIVLKEIAIELDKKYNDHIKNSEKIFVISHLDGRIHEMSKSHIRNYKNFAAFRTIDDARIACSILRDHLKEMYAERK